MRVASDTLKRAAICGLLLLLVGAGVLASASYHQFWPHVEWKQERMHSAVESLGAIAAIGMALVLLDRRRNRPSRYALASGFAAMGILDLFHAGCADSQGLVLLHVVSCLAGATGYALAWLPPPARSVRKSSFWLLAALSTVLGAAVLVAGETLPQDLYVDGNIGHWPKVISMLAGTLFLVGSVKYIVEFVRTGEREALLFLSLALLFALADFTFATSELWYEEWWSWHLTRLFAFLLAFGFVVRGFLQNAAKVRISLLEQKQVQRVLRKRTRELHERVTELDCLYHSYKIMEQPDLDLAGVFEGVIELLKASVRFSEVSCARIVYEGQEFKTANFRETAWTLRHPVKCCQEPVGFAEICYLKQRPAVRGSVFLAEEDRLLEAVSEQLSETIKRKKLETEISHVSIWERQRFGQELHDDLGQELTGLGYMAQCLRHDLAECHIQEAATAERLALGLQKTIDKTRLIAKGQALSEIDAKEFIPALKTVAGLAEERWGVPCIVQANEGDPMDDEDTANQLLRIAQEAIYNAAKHAVASQIRVQVIELGGHVTVRVRDDGCGIPDQIPAGKGMGLHIMRHRADAICAVLRVRAAKTGGTVVTCTVRLNARRCITPSVRKGQRAAGEHADHSHL